MSKRIQFWRKAVASSLAYTLAFGQVAPAAYGASTDISDIPLSVKYQVAPNIMMTLDDSGSMQWEFTPDEEMRFSMFMYPRPNNPYGGSTYTSQVPNFNDNNVHNFFGRSSRNNKSYYNPDIGYRQKAGFLAACCDSRRCFLATLSLHERVTHIEHALIQMGIP